MKFPDKLWLLVNECTSGAIGWGIDGDTIFVDYMKFENEFLGEKASVFKTRNIVSFVRQLNLYGFRKCSRYSDVHEFKNQYFIRGRQDLLKLMRRKLGYTLDVALPDKLEKYEDYKITEKREKSIPDSLKGIAKIGPQLGTLNNHGYPFSSRRDLNPSLSYGWWGNPYFPLPPVHPMESQSANNCSSTENGENSNISHQIEGKAFLKNFDMYRNIVFVPVPAHQFSMFSGLYNSSYPLPSSNLHQDEKKDGTSYEERS